MKFYSFLICFFLSASAVAQPLQTGAEQLEKYVPQLKGKKAGIVANHTAVVGAQHLVDVLLEKGVNIVRIYAPEHGFRGTADAGEHVGTARDKKTGIEIISLYGKNNKPTAAQLQGVDCLLFDMQDVGVRFYTYISTMHYVMEACAENKVPLIILDRPNPNGFYVDGPILEPAFRSFIGMHPIPIVHGMTLGELAGMINGEGWLKDEVYCKVKVVPCSGYTHATRYTLPIPPSPNLPNQQAVYLYPSLCLFEGTAISLGRGTGFPFQVFGHPALKPFYSFSFTPESIAGAQNPPLKGQFCYGKDLREFPQNELTEDGKIRLEWLLEAYNHYPDKNKFFTPFFYKLCGTESVRHQIEEGKTAAEIRASCQNDIERFKLLRKRYLLYEDFE